jgi:hypothetical protein
MPHMRHIRITGPLAAVLSLTLVLAACAQDDAIGPPPSMAPSPIATETPSLSPSVEPSPSAAPSVEPAPSLEAVIELELPMLARVTEDAVDVRSLPASDAPLLSGERISDGATIPDVRLARDQVVLVTMGPVYVGGTSWYEVAITDGEDLYWEGGWVSAELLSDEGNDPTGMAPTVVIYGIGSGTAASADVAVGTPVTVRFAATPMADADQCEIDVTLIRSDGTAVNVATDTVSEPEVVEMTPDEMSGLWQEEAGQVTLQVKSDCSYAAKLIAP